MFKDLFESIKKRFKGGYKKSRTKSFSMSHDFNVIIEGIPTFELIRNGKVINKITWHNIVTQRMSVFAQKLFMMQAGNSGITHIALGIGDPFGIIPDNLNDGNAWVCNAPPAAPVTGGRVDATTGRTILVNEIARKKIDTRNYLKEDLTVSQTILGTGETVSLPTHIGEYKALFLEHEGNGPLMEFGLCGGDVYPNEMDYIPSYKVDNKGVLLEDVNEHFIPLDNTAPVYLINPGDLVTYKTHKLFYKTSEDRLRVSYIVKVSLNNAEPEPAAD